MVTHLTCPPRLIRIRPQLFKISCLISFLALSLNGEESLKKLNNSRFQIWIRIFTKIESIIRCHISNKSTKFRPNPSPTFWDIVLYIVFGPISQWWNFTWKKFSCRDSDIHRNLNSSSLSHSTYPPNFIRIRPQLFEISCTQTNKQTERGENITSFTFGGGGNNYV